MRELIINADDFGADQSRNAGIEEAVQAGIVTSLSVLPNGPALEDALQRIRSWSHLSFSLGIHLNLSEGRPLTSGLKTLIDGEGNFLGKAGTRHLFTGAADPALKQEISCELDCQIESIFSAGLQIDHLDSHQHVHIFPMVFPIVAQKIRQHGIPWMRMPLEAGSSPEMHNIPVSIREDASFFIKLAESAKVEARGYDHVHCPDHFRGLFLKEGLTLDPLIEMLRKLPSGLTEWMVHPGRVPKEALGAPFSNFSTEDRQNELNLLLHPALRQELKRNSIILTCFPGILNREGR